MIIGYLTIQKRYKGIKNNSSAQMIGVFSLKKEVKIAEKRKKRV